MASSIRFVAEARFSTIWRSPFSPATVLARSFVTRLMSAAILESESRSCWTLVASRTQVMLRWSSGSEERSGVDGLPGLPEEWDALLGACELRQLRHPLLAQARAIVRGEREPTVDATPSDDTALRSTLFVTSSPLSSGQVCGPEPDGGPTAG